MRCRSDIQIDLDHVWRLTDDFGILQHARLHVPDPTHGYCTDDNARALVAVVRASLEMPDERERCLAASKKYLDFLAKAYNPATRRFRNFASTNRKWLEEVGSGDSHGRAIWALGEAIALCPTERDRAADLFRRSLPALEEIDHPRSLAFAILGLHACAATEEIGATYLATYQRVASRLAQLFDGKEDDWPWPENRLTYANARLPQSLLLAGRDLDDNEMVDKALRALGWLLEIQTHPIHAHFSPIGNDGWYSRNEARALFCQQPIEAAAMADACVAASVATGDLGWLDKAESVLRWFTGQNDLLVRMIDSSTRGNYDGLSLTKVNRNQGAESILVWIIAALNMVSARQEYVS